MLRSILFKDIGPFHSTISVDSYDYHFNASEVVGIYGHGKTFVLNSIWWALTGTFLQSVNYKVMTGRLNIPMPSQKNPVVKYSFTTDSGIAEIEKEFIRRAQVWTPTAVGQIKNYSGLVVHALEDGGFALYDPVRNQRKTSPVPAYVFTESELLHGLVKDSTDICNGLIRDVAGWQNEGSEVFIKFSKLLTLLSGANYNLQLGELTRVSLDDIRDMPTMRMPDGTDVPVIMLPYGIRRIVELAYILVWGVDENNRAAKVLGIKPDLSNLVLLVDNLDSNLGDVLRENIIHKLGSVLEYLTSGTQYQIIISSSNYEFETGVPHKFMV